MPQVWPMGSVASLAPTTPPELQHVGRDDQPHPDARQYPIARTDGVMGPTSTRRFAASPGSRSTPTGTFVGSAPTADVNSSGWSRRPSIRSGRGGRPMPLLPLLGLQSASNTWMPKAPVQYTRKSLAKLVARERTRKGTATLLPLLPHVSSRLTHGELSEAIDLRIVRSPCHSEATIKVWDRWIGDLPTVCGARTRQRRPRPGGHATSDAPRPRRSNTTRSVSDRAPSRGDDVQRRR